MSFKRGYSQQHRDDRDKNYGRSNRRGNNTRGGDRQRKTQGQVFVQDTRQLEQQVIFLDQLRKCFRLVEMHLDNIVVNEDREELDDSASSMVTGLNLVRLAVADMEDNQKAVKAGKFALAKFLERCEEKYDGVGEERNRGKVISIVGAVQSHIGCVLSGGDVPVMQINGLDPMSRNDSKLANSAMQFVVLGGHRVGDLRRDVQTNAEMYEAQVETEARTGSQFDKAFDVQFTAGSVEVLQGDMVKLTPFADESQQQAQASLREMIRHREAPVDMFDDEEPGADADMPDAGVGSREASGWKSKWGFF